MIYKEKSFFKENSSQNDTFHMIRFFQSKIKLSNFTSEIQMLELFETLRFKLSLCIESIWFYTGCECSVVWFQLHTTWMVQFLSNFMALSLSHFVLFSPLFQNLCFRSLKSLKHFLFIDAVIAITIEWMTLCASKVTWENYL